MAKHWLMKSGHRTFKRDGRNLVIVDNYLGKPYAWTMVERADLETLIAAAHRVLLDTETDDGAE